ncbi:MAG TPA: hypothetical protein VNY83_02810 [Solirubrobacterales bacterium]|jgi:hypothetical protein|nr:hypothetical protein [Solirubrobacterales bacterium]
MASAWLLFPALLLAACLGCGLLLELALGRRLPGLLLAPAGFAVVVVVAGLATATSATAPLATPAVAALALAGIGLSFPWEGRRPEPWALGAALAVFAIYAAPIVASGHPTFAGYIKLDDTATWMAFVDRLMEHGRSLSGLAPSTYQRTLEVNLPGGYPVGAFGPLGVGTQLSGADVAWLVQPYMASLAALLTLCLAQIARPLIDSRPLRALCAAAALSALLYGYGLWGGVKELATALALATLAATVPIALERGRGWRVLPLALAAAALLSIAGTGGAAWLAPILALAALLLLRAQGPRAALARAVPFAIAAALLGAPAILAGASFSPTQGALTSASELGNLVHPLLAAQYVGIWAVGDFRLRPDHVLFTDALIALAIACAGVGGWAAWRRRATALGLYAGAGALGTAAIVLYASPWVGAKALASASPSFLLLALVGAATLAQGIVPSLGKRLAPLGGAAARSAPTLGLAVLTLLLAGVAVSDALAYHDASLAPYAQLRELQSIGHQIAGQGPTLLTEYNPYGARHLLREADAEGASELRSRPIALREGGEARKGEWVDTDRISLPALLTYRTLVLRRNPVQSRPPAVYQLIRQGHYYDLWQRPPAEDTLRTVEHLPLGGAFDPAGVPRCAAVLRLAREAGPEGKLAAAIRAPNIVASLGESQHPASWAPTEAGGPALVPRGPGVARLTVRVPAAGRYEAYVGGSARNELSLALDGRPLGSVSNQLNESGQYLYLGAARLAPDTHTITLTYSGQTLAPGSGGPPEPIGPLVLSPLGADPPVTYLPPSRARELCGKHLDWVEALAP